MVTFKTSRLDADVPGVAEGERKNSEDLIREANERLRGTADTHQEPIIESESSAEPIAETAEPTDPASGESAEDPLRAALPTGDGAQQSFWTSLPWVRWVLIGLLVGGGYLFSSWGDANRDGSGEIVDPGALDVMALQVGDCFNDPEEEEEVVVDVAAVPCSEPHDNQVFAVLSLETAFPDDSFPGQDALGEYTYEICSGSVFDSYVGTAYLDSSLEVFSFTPTEESWGDGDRGFACALYRLDFAPLTGTARDSGL